MKRCSWVGDDPMYIDYHDKEWGVPVHDDRTHFEFLVLEGAQAGLSWKTILKRREGYRTAFADFDPNIVANYDELKILELFEFEGIIRNKLKIRSAVNNAKAFLQVQQEFGSFDKYIWSFVDHRTVVNAPRSPKEYQATSPESDALSKDMKKRGFSFCGSTIMYAHLQACGLVNDHQPDCFRYKELVGGK